LGSINSGTEAFARVVLATETIVSFAGPACAGAIEVAVSVAQMSNAVRKEANIQTINVR
jgi:hypothetical protein